MILIKPITTEKAIRNMELENRISFIVDRRATKDQIKREIEQSFNVKTEKINTLVKNNEKTASIKLKKEFKASDIGAKLGMI